MQPFILLPFLVASALAGDLLGAAPIVHSVEPLPQYTHEQNTATGEYGYSYQGGPSAKTEFRATDGTTTGTYSYVDAHGLLQTVSYIADEFGFRAAGSNIPSEGAVPLDAPEVAAAKAAHLAEHSRATLAALGHQRRKRGAILPAALPIAHAAYPVAVAHSALPLATSSQSRFQIHNGAKIVHEIATPIVETRTHILSPSLALYRKKRGIAAYAAPLPASSAKIYGELSQQPILRTAAIATPVAAHAAYAAPVVAAHAAIATPLVSHSVVESLPLATSSQSRFQIHNSAKIVQEVAAPVVAAAAPIVEAKAAIPIASHTVVESVPLATSSQSRFQIHNGAKIIQEFHQPLLAAAAPIHAAPAFPAFAPIHAQALPSGPIYSGSLGSHEFGVSAAALPAEASSFGDDAITVESA